MKHVKSSEKKKRQKDWRTPQPRGWSGTFQSATAFKSTAVPSAALAENGVMTETPVAFSQPTERLAPLRLKCLFFVQ
jgi:hypothetical protein